MAKRTYKKIVFEIKEHLEKDLQFYENVIEKGYYITANAEKIQVDDIECAKRLVEYIKEQLFYINAYLSDI